jgi:hypothetical protein
MLSKKIFKKYLQRNLGLNLKKNNKNKGISRFLRKKNNLKDY